MTLLDDERRMLARCEEASVGWKVSGRKTDGGRTYCNVNYPSEKLKPLDITIRLATEIDPADAEFIANARTDLPKVLWRLSDERWKKGVRQKQVDMYRVRCAKLKEATIRLRDNILNDPDHDNDTINWALGLLDDELGE